MHVSSWNIHYFLIIRYKFAPPPEGVRYSGSGIRVPDFVSQNSGSDFHDPGFGVSSQSKNNYFTEKCSGSEAGSYFKARRFIDH